MPEKRRRARVSDMLVKRGETLFFGVAAHPQAGEKAVRRLDIKLSKTGFRTVLKCRLGIGSRLETVRILTGRSRQIQLADTPGRWSVSSKFASNTVDIRRGSLSSKDRVVDA